VGPDFAGSVPVIYILAIAVAIRVGNSTATTVLKGSGHHRLLAGSNLLIALANLMLSLFLVRRLGLIGVALGTLVALGTVSILVLFPAACRRVGLSIGEMLKHAVWPAIWPALAMALFLTITRRFISVNLPAVAAQAMAGGLIYLVVFLGLAISQEERRWYIAKLKQLIRRQDAYDTVSELRTI